jgi:hypothetical protein
MYKNISAELSDENKNLVIQKAREIKEILSFLVNLSVEERKTLPVMGPGSIKFTEDSLGYAEKHPNIVAPYLDIAEQRRDLTLAKQLYDIIEVIGPLWEEITDTYMAVGAEAFAAGRVFYKSLKAASDQGVPGTDTIAADLGRRYDR